jgi:hypothetical protein
MAPDQLRRRAIARALANGGASAVRRLRLGGHRAAVYIARLERNSGVRVTGPAASEGDPDADRELVLDELEAAA